ncbi:hypothetical protein [Candidatus Thiosymbion oneisti]|uniref:hypothetical protein n=1 Tax=Candidatus Thiosymbion oneisti TaxID=589554 RepID=UPI000B7FC42C|nr:hypothetical protein [Candidatus Thiosymbion oneisti]
MSTYSGLTTETTTEAAVPTSLKPWLSDEKGKARSLIVEVKVPERRIAFERGRLTDRVFPKRSVENDREGRRSAIQTLADFLEHEIGLQARVLETAGAIVVSATPNQVRRFLQHPLTKGVHPNRALARRMW